MELLKYILRSAWQEAGLMGRTVYFIGVAVPAALSTVAGRTSLPILTDIADALPWWGWLFFATLVALIGLLKAIGQRAHRLDDEKEPRIACNDLSFWLNDGWVFVRAQVENTSSSNIEGLTPYIETIGPDDPAKQIESANLPKQILSQARLDERRSEPNAEGEGARPINLRAKQKKWLEVFQTRARLYDRELRIVNPSVGFCEMFTLPRMEFGCGIYGLATPTRFTVIYEEIEKSWRATLLNESGEIIRIIHRPSGESEDE